MSETLDGPAQRRRGIHPLEALGRTQPPPSGSAETEVPLRDPVHTPAVADRFAGLSVRVPESLRRRLRLAAIEDGVSVKRLVIEAIETLLDERARRRDG